jgi:hypothetical protein
VFFLGLLSTPLPYLLLAAFYFFGFAMGMFNNSTGEEISEPVSTLTIPVEIKQKTTDHSVYYYQVSSNQDQTQRKLQQTEDSTSLYSPDTGTITHPFRTIKVHEFLHSGFQFSRPPPACC